MKSLHVTWLKVPRKAHRALFTRLSSLDWRFIVAFSAPLGLYLLTLAPTIYNLDSAELTTAAATGGLTRSTGYPLYLMLGYIWTRLPLGDVGYRMNLFSALCSALTIVLGERILRRWRVGNWATFAALGMLATAPYFWALSLIAEVYTLHTAMMAALILLIAAWADQPSRRRLFAFSLVLGLSLGHHASTLLLIPGLAWFVLVHAPKQALHPKALVGALVGVLLGASVYLYLPLRFIASPVFNYAGRYDAAGIFHPINLLSWAGFWSLISAQSFSSQMLAYSAIDLWTELLHFLEQLSRAFLTIGIGPGIIGMVILARRNWKTAGLLGLMFIVHAGFYIDYRVGDKELMFLPNYLIWALWVGIGCQGLLDWVKTSSRFAFANLDTWLLRIVMAGGVLVSLLWNWSLVDQSDDWSARQRGEDILQLVEPRALVFGFWDTVPVVQYLQFVEGQRPEVKAINRFLISSNDMRSLILAETGRIPVYIDAPPPDLPDCLRVVDLEVIFRLEATIDCIEK